MTKKLDIRQSYVYSSPWIRIREDHYIQDGVERTYNVVERDNSVVIFPLTPNKRTILLKHFRYPTQQYSIEVPMGGVDEGETIEQAARRELEEEVKIAAEKLEHIGVFYPVPGLTSQQINIFVAKVDESPLDKANLDLNQEDIEGLSLVHLDDVYTKVAKGEITDGFTVGSLLFLKLYMDKQNNE